VRGDIDRRDDVFREHAPERRAHGEFFHARDRFNERADDSVCPGDRQSIGVVVAGAEMICFRDGHFVANIQGAQVLVRPGQGDRA